MDFKKILVKVFYVFLIFILIFNLSMIVQEKIYPEKIPSFLGIKILTMNSKNMEPKLKEGDILLIRLVKQDKINKKDIIIYRQGFEIVVNRVTDKIEDDTNILFKTKGDNNNSENSGTIKYDLLEGKVIGKIPLVRKVFFKRNYNNFSFYNWLFLYTQKKI